MEKVESPLEVLSRAATMVQCYPASDSDSFETPSTPSGGESEGDRTLSPEGGVSRGAPQAKELPTAKWRRDRRVARLPDYKPRENGKMALRSQSFNERRSTAPLVPLRLLQPHSDGDISDESEDAERHQGVSRPALNGGSRGAPPEYPAVVGAGAVEAPIDMRLRARPSPPPYPQRASVITRSQDPPPSSMSMCDPVIDEHFRRSLGDDYMTLFGKKNPDSAAAGPKPNTKDRGSSPIRFASDPCANFLASKDPQTEEPQPAKVIEMDVDEASLSVDDHFTKALGDTWKKIQTSRLNVDAKTTENEKPVKESNSKIISRRGVVI